MIRLSNDTVRGSGDFLGAEAGPAAVGAAEASFSKRVTKPAPVELPLSKEGDVLDDNAIEAALKAMDDVADVAHRRLVADTIRRPASPMALSDEAILPTFSAAYSTENSGDKGSDGNGDGSSDDSEGSSSTGSALGGSKPDKSHHDTDIDVRGTDEKNDPPRVEPEGGMYTELELFATDHERQVAAMICETIASPDRERAIETYSPSDIASSAQVHMAKVRFDAYTYLDSCPGSADNYYYFCWAYCWLMLL